MTVAIVILSMFGGASVYTLVSGWSLRRTRKQIIEHRLTLWRERERAYEARKMLEDPKEKTKE